MSSISSSSSSSKLSKVMFSSRSSSMPAFSLILAETKRDTKDHGGGKVTNITPFHTKNTQHFRTRANHTKWFTTLKNTPPETLIFSLLWPHGHWTWNAYSYKMFSTESLITGCILELFFKLKDHFPQTKLLLTCTHDLSTFSFTTHWSDPGPGVTSTINFLTSSEINSVFSFYYSLCGIPFFFKTISCLKTPDPMPTVSYIHTIQFAILLTRLWQFSVGFQVTRLVSCVLEDYISLCVLVISQTKQNDVPRVDPHLHETSIPICKKWHGLQFISIQTWTTHQLQCYSTTVPSPFKSDLKVELSSCNLQVQLQARLFPLSND